MPAAWAYSSLGQEGLNFIGSPARLDSEDSPENGMLE